MQRCSDIDIPAEQLLERTFATAPISEYSKHSILARLTHCNNIFIEDRSIKASCLSRLEQSKALAYRDKRSRNLYILGKLFTRKILGNIFNVQPEDIKLSETQAGKPEVILDTKCNQPIQFSLSKSNDMILLGVHRSQPIGVDLECHKAIPDLLDVACVMWGIPARRELAELPSKERIKQFYQRWCQMESELKAFGLGVGNQGAIDRSQIDAHQSGPINMPSGYSGWFTVLHPKKINL